MTTAQKGQTIVEPIKRGEGEGNYRFSFGSNVMSSGEFLRRNLYNESPFKNLIRTPSSTSNCIETTQRAAKTFEDEFGSDDNEEDNNDDDGDGGDLQLDELIARTEQNFAYSKNLTVKIQDKLNLLNLHNDDLHQLMEEFDILLQSPKKESQEKGRKVLNPLPTPQDDYDHHEEQNQQQYHHQKYQQRTERTSSSSDSLQSPQLQQRPKPLQDLHQNQQLQQHQPQFMNDHSEAEDDNEYDTSLEHNARTPFDQQIHNKLNQIPSSFQAKDQVEEIFKTTINLIHGLQNEEIVQDQGSDEEEVMTEVMGRIKGNFERFVDSLR